MSPQYNIQLSESEFFEYKWYKLKGNEMKTQQLTSKRRRKDIEKQLEGAY